MLNYIYLKLRNRFEPGDGLRIKGIMNPLQSSFCLRDG